MRRSGIVFAGILALAGCTTVSSPRRAPIVSAPTRSMPPATASAPAGLAPQFPKPTHRIAISASSTWAHTKLDNAMDGDPLTVWNAGQLAPAWIEIDLGDRFTLDGIELIVDQTPNGATVHEVYISDTPIGAGRQIGKLAHRFAGRTSDNQVLAGKFAVPARGRFVQVLTTQSPSWVSWREIKVLCDVGVLAKRE